LTVKNKNSDSKIEITNKNSDSEISNDLIRKQNQLLIEQNKELEYYKNKLELLVSKRTEDINTISSELKKKNQEIVRKNENLNLLIQEVHHRVANNLQIILSLINIKYLSKDTNVENNRFKDLENRILSMSLIHQNILNKGLIGQTDFDSYISDLVRHIQSSNGFKKNINLVKKIDSFSMLPNTILYLGLIITEIISNSIKHGLENTETPTITIRIRKDKYYNIFEIEDNGKGFDSELWDNHQHSSGFDVIKLLSEQIDGEIIYLGDKKTKFELTIPFS